MICKKNALRLSRARGTSIHNFKINNYKPPPYDLAVKREGYKLKMKLYGGNTFRILSLTAGTVSASHTFYYQSNSS